MSQTKRSRLVFENDINWGTFLVPDDDLPRTEWELVENIFHGNASVFEPHKNPETKEEEPTILIVRDDKTYREISMSLREPQTICKRSMMGTNQPNLFARMLEEHKEPLSVLHNRQRPAPLSASSQTNTSFRCLEKYRHGLELAVP